MIKIPEIKILKNNESNLKVLIAIGERKPSKEYHILRNKRKLVLVTHFIWDRCEFCNLDIEEDGIIDM